MRNYYLVAVGRDPSLLEYCRPDLIVTVNRCELAGKIPLIALSDFSDSNSYLELQNTDLMYLLAPEREGERVPRAVTAEIAGAGEKLRDKFFEEVRNKSAGKNVVINPYYNTFSGHFKEAGWRVVGPADDVAYELSRKTAGYKLAKEGGVPVPEGEIVKSLAEVKRYVDANNNDLGFFVASDGDPFYPTNLHILKTDELDGLPPEEPYLVTKWLQRKRSQNSQIIVGEKNILFLGLTDQIIKDGVKYYGNVYPSAAPAELKDKIRKYSLAVGRIMQERGYRGITGFDWIETDDGGIYFSEINPRKNRSTGILASFIDHYRPQGSPSVFEIEMRASEGGIFSEEEIVLPEDVFWSMELFKIKEQVTVTKEISPKYSEGNIFGEPGNPKVEILNLPKGGTVAGPSSGDIAKIVSAGSDLTEVKEGITRATEEIQKSLSA